MPRPGPPRARPWVAVALVALLAACSPTSAGPSGGPQPDGTAAGPVVRVASFDFAESRLLGELYAQALERHGVPVTRHLGLGPRELVQPALAQGLVDLVPEYSGSARRFLASTRGSAPHRSANDLATLLHERGLTPLDAAPAQNANAVVVTARTARASGLRRVSDLVGVAASMRFGAPPECPERPYCLPGLEDRYGLAFAEFVPMPDYAVTVAALAAGEVDVGLLGTTDPHLGGDDLVLLEDDGELQPDEQVVPVVRREVLAEVGPVLAEAVAKVSARLTTAELVALNREMVVEREPVEEVAEDWLDDLDDRH